MQTIQTQPVAPTTVADATTPPPLPLPGSSTGGREELPAPRQPEQPPSGGHRSGEERPGGRPRGRGGCASALGGPVRTYLVMMVFFTVLWAVSGGGHFWPVWPMLGWGLGLALSGQVPVGPSRRVR